LQSVLTDTSPYSEDTISKIIEITLQTHNFDSVIFTKIISGNRNIITNSVDKEFIEIGTVITDERSLSQKNYTRGEEFIMSLKDYDILPEE
jgi:hypothetical protein